MNKNVVLGLVLFIITEVLCVVALFSSDWVVSKHLGDLRIGLTVLCHGPPGKETLCMFTIPHASWLGGALVMVVAVLFIGLSVCLLVVALHKQRKSFVDAAKWTGVGGIISLCIVGIVFPLGFSTLELGGRAFLLPITFTTGYSYAIFNFSILSCITALLATNKFFACALFRNR